MKLATESGEYHAHFIHKNVSKRPRRPHFVTEVRLHEGPCTLEGPEGAKRCVTESLIGEARCHSKLDVFNKAEGRARALHNAMLRIAKEYWWDGEDQMSGEVSRTEFLPRPVRIQIWDAYKAQAKLPTSRASR